MSEKYSKQKISTYTDNGKVDRKEVIYRPIGIVQSSFKKTEGVPIQAVAGRGIEGKLIIFPEYVEGLADLEGFSHIFLIYHFHLYEEGYTLKVKPFLDNKKRGVFATRAPRRPNALGISVVRLSKVEGNILYIMDVDIVDGAPLLDIKPYIPEFDIRDVERSGWYKGKGKESFLKRSDNRFK